MQLIKNNPYRTVGLLVGATAKEQDRQIRRLRQFIDAEQEPQDDFSFQTLGTLHRTIENVTEAASKLNLTCGLCQRKTPRVLPFPPRWRLYQ